MNEDEQEDTTTVEPSSTTEETVVVTTEPGVTTDPLKTELDKVQGKKRTKAEKLLYTRDRIDEQLKEMGIEDEDPQDEDDKPVTVGMMKKMQSQNATKTALQMADNIASETERELVKHHLENTIKSTGNPAEDFKLAQSLVNSVKNSQIIEETIRKPGTKPSSGGGAPAKVEKQVDFTPEELSFMKPPFNLTKEEVIAARPK